MATLSAPPATPMPMPPVLHPPPPTLAPSSVKIYNAVYSSVQVYECMVRGIAVMRRRSDSFVNATQILKVAGIDKGRRTKILEKEILPGKHEIVQGGYGKYQGTWIPLDRGRELASQYGVAPLLAPLFDFIPNPNNAILPMPRSATPGRPGSVPPFPFQYNPALHSHPLASGGPAPQIMPGAAMKLLSQGRAQGLFGPASPINPLLVAGMGGPVRGHAPPPRPLQPSTATSSALKRVRSEALGAPPSSNGASNIDASRRDGPAIQADRQPPAKRPRTESGASPDTPSSAQASPAETRSRPPTLVRRPGEGSRQADTTSGNRASSPAERPTSPATASLPAVGLNGKQVNGTRFDPVPRFATKASTHRHADRTAFLRNPKRAMVLAAIQAGDEDTEDILRALGDAAEPPLEGSPPDVDIVLDDQGHTALHLASSLARLPLAQALVEAGADVTRGSFSGETPLIRTVLTTHAFEDQAFSSIVSLLHPSIRILDNSRRTVLHHVAHVAGIRGRAPAARYYMECVLMWIAQREGGDFKSVVDLQDEHGDTALNIAARVGNRSLVKMLLDVGANRITPNKLGLRPGDFGVEGEDTLEPTAGDMLASLRTTTTVPAQKSKDVISEITTLISGLQQEFETEVKDKQEALEKGRIRLRKATRELADQRRQIQQWQVRCSELEETQQRIRNIQRATDEENKFDWSGRTEFDGSPAKAETVGAAFAHRGLESSMLSMELTDAVIDGAPEPEIPTENTPEALAKLRKIRAWYKRTDKLLQDRLKALQGSSAERELRCQKIIALATGLNVAQVEQMTTSLLIAMDGDPGMTDLERVATFMTKVRNGDTEPQLPWNLSR